MVECCNAPDITFHNCNSNSCHFWLCVVVFPPWLGFCLLFSCHASHLIASCALHLHVFIKLASVRSCRIFPLPLLTIPRPARVCLPLAWLPNLSAQPANPSHVPETSPNPTRAVITVGFGSSPNIPEISSLSSMSVLAYFFQNRRISIEGPKLALN